MKSNLIRVALCGALALPVAAMIGCWGVHEVEEVRPTTAAFRIESEVIPDADLVREDTSPYWQLGRYAFKRGGDKLLVVSRVTSWADAPDEPTSNKEEKQQKYDEKTAPIIRKDRIVERVWITLPMGTPVGEEMKIEALEARFLTGYDEDEGVGYFAQPHRLLGKVTVLEQSDDKVVIRLVMAVSPERKTPWSINEVMTLSPTRDGIRATPADLTRTGVVKPGEGAAGVTVPAPAPAADAAPVAEAAPAEVTAVEAEPVAAPAAEPTK